MITLTEKEKSVIIQNRQVLAGLFERHIEDMKISILYMPAGTERDGQIEMVKNFIQWKSDILNVQAVEQSKKYGPI